MTVRSEIRLDVPSVEQLQTLAEADLPLGLKGTTAARDFYREVYYDTADGELQKRGVAVHVRHTMDDRRLLSVRVGATAVGGAFKGGEEFTADVTAEDPNTVMMGSSAPARRLKAVIDPSRLQQRIEVITDRQFRHTRAGLFPLPRLEIAYDKLTARQGDSTAEYYQVAIRELRTSKVSVEELAKAMSEQHSIRIVMADPVERAMSMIASLESDALAEAVREHREVTVVAVDSRRIALVRGRDDLRLPFRTGGGEEDCREVLRETFGSGEGQVARLGIVPATQTRPAIEVWLARRLNRSVSTTGSIQWFLSGEIVARVGSPVLRDPRTLAALTVASRSELLPEWSAAASDDWRGDTALPTDEYAVSSRRTLVELTVPILREEALNVEKGAPEQFINAELSWLEFNARVLALAEDPSVPLLARVRFLSIFSTNLDEFFQVKVAGLKQAAAAGLEGRSPDGLTAAEQLDAIAIRLRGLVERQYACLDGLLQRELPEQGIRVRRWAELSESERAHLTQFFEDQAFPVLTPRAITRAPGHPFPMIE